MLGKVKNEILIPIGLPITECESAHTMRSRVREDRIGTINNFPSSIPKATTEVYVFKPHREKSFIEAAKRFPCLTLHRKTSPRWLLNLLRLLVVKVKAAIAHIPGIPRPNAVHEQHLCQHASDGRKPSNGEALLGQAFCAL